LTARWTASWQASPTLGHTSSPSQVYVRAHESARTFDGMLKQHAAKWAARAGDAAWIACAKRSAALCGVLTSLFALSGDLLDPHAPALWRLLWPLLAATPSSATTPTPACALLEAVVGYAKHVRALPSVLPPLLAWQPALVETSATPQRALAEVVGLNLSIEYYYV
jgi:hypothetical protein